MTKRHSDEGLGRLHGPESLPDATCGCRSDVAPDDRSHSPVTTPFSDLAPGGLTRLLRA